MQLSRDEVLEYARKVDMLSEAAREAVVRALMELDVEQLYGSYYEAVLAVLEGTCPEARYLATVVSADFYDNVRARYQLPEFGAPVEPEDRREADGRAAAAIVAEAGGSRERLAQLTGERAAAETRRAAQVAVAHAADVDPAKPRYARVPTGAETCRFCITLASRGYVYHSKDTASHAHANCDCVVVPSFKGTTVEGYDPDYYRDVYDHPEDHPEVDEAYNARRRELYRQRREQERGESGGE